MGKYILHDGPSIVEARYRGWLPGVASRAMFRLAVVAFCLMYVTVVWQSISAHAPEGWYLQWPWVWRLVIALTCMGAPLLLVILFATLLLSDHRQFWLTARWNQERKEFTGVTPAWLLWKRDQRSVPFRVVKQLKTMIGPETGGPLLFQIEMELASGLPITIPLRIDQVDQRDEAIDLSFVIARLMGFATYRVVNNDSQQLEIAIFRDPPDKSGSRLPLPDEKRGRHYDFNMTSTGVLAPEPIVGEFEADLFTRRATTTLAWNNGKDFAICQNRRHRLRWAACGIGVGLLGAWTTWLVRDKFAPTLPTYAPGMAAALFGSLALAGESWRRGPNKIAFELANRRVRWRTGVLSKSVSLDEVRSVEIVGRKRTYQRKDTDAVTQYRCVVQLVFHRGSRLSLARNRNWLANEDAQRRDLEPFAAHLAKLLHVPWRWRGTLQTKSEWLIKAIATLLITTAVLTVAGFFVWGSWYQSMRRNERSDSAKVLSKSGFDVYEGDAWVEEQNVFGDGWLVKAQPATASEDAIQRMFTVLPPEILCGFDFSECNVTNEAIRQNIREQYAFYLNLRRTPVTPAIIESLARSSVRVLDVRETDLHLEHLAPFHSSHALMALYITDPDVTNDDLVKLLSVPGLDFVLVNDATTTQVLLERIDRELRPGTSLQVAPEPKLPTQRLP
ncbi:MAG: hypothetical protein KDA60_03135 [Planctomycetales bacterium]|nr:hypothetical protein [Planctomycetales bacterium]